MRSPLTDEQIAETLRRYELPPDAQLLGIQYRADRAALVVRGVLVVGGSDIRILTVPPDVLERPPPLPTPARIFNRPS